MDFDAMKKTHGISKLLDTLYYLQFEIRHKEEIIDKNTIFVPIEPDMKVMEITLGYLHLVKEKYRKNVCVICSERYKDFVALYSKQFDSAKFLKKEKLEEYFDRRLVGIYENNKYMIVCPSAYFTKGFSYIKTIPEINLLDFICYSILDLE